MFVRLLSAVDALLLVKVFCTCIVQLSAFIRLMCIIPAATASRPRSFVRASARVRLSRIGSDRCGPAANPYSGLSYLFFQPSLLRLRCTYSAYSACRHAPHSLRRTTRGWLRHQGRRMLGRDSHERLGERWFGFSLFLRIVLVFGFGQFGCGQSDDASLA